MTTASLPFQYQAFHLVHKTVDSGVIYADNEREARLILREQQLIPTRIQLISEHTTQITHTPHLFNLPQRLWLALSLKKHQWQWAQAMSTLHQDGLSLTAALDLVTPLITHHQWHVQLLQIKQALLQGTELHTILTEQQAHLSWPTEIKQLLIQANQYSQPMETFEPLIAWHHKQTEVKRLVPWQVGLILLILWATTLQLLLNTSLSPEAMGYHLLTTLQHSIVWLQQQGLIVLPVLILSATLVTLKSYQQPHWAQSLRQWIYQHLLGVKWLLNPQYSYQFFSTLQLGLSSKLPLLNSLDFTHACFQQSPIHDELTDILTHIKAGKPLGKSMQHLPCLSKNLQQKLALRQTIAPEQLHLFIAECEEEAQRALAQQHQWGLQLSYLWAGLLLLWLAFIS